MSAKEQQGKKCPWQQKSVMSKESPEVDVQVLQELQELQVWVHERGST